jgi:hypothetical protein
VLAIVGGGTLMLTGHDRREVFDLVVGMARWVRVSASTPG